MNKNNTKMPSQEELSILMEHYQNGRFDEAERSARSLALQYPHDNFSWKILGAVLKQTDRKHDAVITGQKAVEINPQDVTAHNNLGNTLKELGRLEEAEASYTQAIALKPDFSEAHNNLGNTLKELGKLEEAEASYRQAIALKSDYAKAHNNLGVTLQELGKLEEAEASYRQAIALKPNYTVAHKNLGNILKELCKYEEAVLHFDLINTPYGKALSLECLYMNKSYSEYEDRLHSMSAYDDKNLRIAAVSAFTANQMKKKDPYRFCPNPLEFILIKNLDEYDYHSNNLINEIMKESAGYKLIWESRTTKFGFQGLPDLFKSPSIAVSNLESIINQAVNDYYNKFKSESNVFIKSWPSEYKLDGWFNRLLKNGFQSSHIHSGGWLSGVIYLKTTAPYNNDEGAIEFGLHGYDLPISDENYPRKIHRPKIGDIVLFPSSLFHRTIPFSTDSERCVIAFDMVRQLPSISKEDG